MKKVLIISIFIIILVLIVGLVYFKNNNQESDIKDLVKSVYGRGFNNMPPQMTLDCHIQGVVEDVKFSEAFNDTCILNNSCPTDYNPEFPAMYILEINLTNINSINGTETNVSTEIKCEDMQAYKLGNNVRLYVLKDDVTEKLQSNIIIDAIIKKPTQVGRIASYSFIQD